jgi:hypothetical protein
MRGIASNSPNRILARALPKPIIISSSPDTDRVKGKWYSYVYPAPSIAAPMTSDGQLIEQFMRGEVDLETVARVLSREKEHFGIGLEKPPPYTEQEQEQIDRLRALFERVDQLQRAQRLIAPTATLQDIDAWDPPDDPDNFCLSIAAELRGRDAELEYAQSMRVYVCTPRWLADRANDDGWMWFTPPPLVVESWQPATIREAIQQLAGAGGDDRWTDFVERLGRFMDHD